MRGFGLLTMIGAVMICPSAIAQQSDAPHRPMGQVFILDMAIEPARDCLSTELDKSGTMRVRPVDGGFDVEWGPPGGLFTKASDKHFFNFQLRETEGVVRLSGLYRKPMSARSMIKTVDGLAKKCLVVKEAREGGP